MYCTVFFLLFLSYLLLRPLVVDVCFRIAQHDLLMYVSFWTGMAVGLVVAPDSHGAEAVGADVLLDNFVVRFVVVLVGEALPAALVLVVEGADVLVLVPGGFQAAVILARVVVLVILEELAEAWIVAVEVLLDRRDLFCSWDCVGLCSALPDVLSLLQGGPLATTWMVCVGDRPVEPVLDPDPTCRGWASASIVILLLAVLARRLPPFAFPASVMLSTVLSLAGGVLLLVPVPQLLVLVLLVLLVLLPGGILSRGGGGGVRGRRG